MIALLSHVGGVVLLLGVILMALPVIRVAPLGYTPLFEIGLALFLGGLVITLAGAIGWVISWAFGLSLIRYPLTGG